MRARSVLPPLALLTGLVGAWELAARVDLIADALSIEPFLVPAPSEIGEALWEDRSLLASDAWVTLQEVLLGFAAALVAGVATAVAMHLSPPLRRALQPLVVGSQTLPIPAIAPILIIWFGFGIGPKLAIIALICFFPIAVNAHAGLSAVDPELTKMMRTLDADRRRILWAVEAPAALPQLFTGAKIAGAVAFIGAVFAEWAGSSEGLGHLILVAQAQIQTDRVFAAITLLSGMAIAFYSLITLLERRVVSWSPIASPDGPR